MAYFTNFQKTQYTFKKVIKTRSLSFSNYRKYQMIFYSNLI